VNASRFPLRINVGFLINQPIGTSRDIHFEFPQLRLSDLELSDVNGTSRVGRTPQGLLVQGDFTARTTCECVRCLDEFSQSLRADFSELFAFRFKGVTESGLVLPEDGNIDLDPLVREYILLDMPISPLCRPDCKGLCIYCGANLNEGLCEHQLQNMQ
jgi:uncharacterized protein